MSLWVLHGAVKRVNSFGLYGADEYTYEIHDGEGCNVEDCPLRLDTASQNGLARTMSFYWYSCHFVVFLGLVFDVCRALGVTSAASDALLGFQSAARERRRKFAFLTLLVPFLHLVYWFSRPIAFGCCVATPKREYLKERVNTLAFLLSITAFILLGKSQDHGYFFLRVPPQESCAYYLLRDHLINKEDELHGGKAKARTGSLILMALGQGGGMSEDHLSDDCEEAQALV